MNTFIGNPCRKCGNTERYFSGKKPCVKCVKENSKRRFENGETRKWNQKNNDKVNSKNKDYYHSLTPEQKILRNRRQQVSLYGLTLEDYDNMLDRQDEVCKICKNICPTGKNLSIDHDHKTGKVRGLLCKNCNIGLGSFFDNIDFLESAVLYLKSS
jgi:hypothetical protein